MDQVKRKPDNEEKLINFIRNNKRKYTNRDAIMMLHGSSAFLPEKPDTLYCPEFGLLSSWYKEDIEEALENLIRSKKLVNPPKGLWKHRLSA